MKRGEIYLVRRLRETDPRRARPFVVVSRQGLIDSPFSTVICAPVYTSHAGLTPQVPAGPEVGLKHDSSIHCDELTSLPKSSLRDFVGTLTDRQLTLVDGALRVALGVGRQRAR